MSEINVIEELKVNLVPGGTADIIALRFTDNFFNGEFVRECIDELSNKMKIGTILDEPLNALEKLAVQLLLDSANIKL